MADKIIITGNSGSEPVFRLLEGGFALVVLVVGIVIVLLLAAILYMIANGARVPFLSAPVPTLQECTITYPNYTWVINNPSSNCSLSQCPKSTRETIIINNCTMGSGTGGSQNIPPGCQVVCGSIPPSPTTPPIGANLTNDTRTPPLPQNQTPPAPECVSLGFSCYLDSQCCSGRCVDYMCASLPSGNSPCAQIGQSCSSSLCCAGGQCSNATRTCVGGYDSANPARCSDTDGGRNYPMQGKIYNYRSRAATDTCASPNVLTEYYCPSPDLQFLSENVTCPNGCVNGSCVSTTAPPTPPSSTVLCFDTDGGINTTVFGTTSGNNFAGQYVTGTDYCADSSQLAEYYCSDNVVRAISQNCPSGCSNGICLPSATVPSAQCQPVNMSCGPGYNSCCEGSYCDTQYYTCRTTGTSSPSPTPTSPAPPPPPVQTPPAPTCGITMQSCSSTPCCTGYYCNMAKVCASGATGSNGCIDSDGGVSPSASGNIIGPNVSGGAVYQYLDVCVNTDTLTEMKCASSGGVLINSHETVQCIPGTCSSGRCAPLPLSGIVGTQANCLDTDGGIVPGVFGNVTGHAGPGIAASTQSDRCTGPLTLAEYYCNTTTGYNAFTYSHCENGCSNGVCLAPQCIETDGGLNLTSSGKITLQNGNVLSDTCLNSSHVREYYCTPSSPYYSKSDTRCVYGCSKGACKPSLSFT